MTIRLVLDEMISPSISSGLWQAGVDNYPVRDRGLLKASDPQVWARAQFDCRALVTINEVHFRRLARAEPAHFGLLVIPDGGTREQQLAFVMTAVSYVQNIQITFENLLAKVLQDRTVLIDYGCVGVQTA